MIMMITCPLLIGSERKREPAIVDRTPDLTPGNDDQNVSVAKKGPTKFQGDPAIGGPQLYPYKKLSIFSKRPIDTFIFENLYNDRPPFLHTLFWFLHLYLTSHTFISHFGSNDPKSESSIILYCLPFQQLKSLIWVNPPD